jgi:hypothetical protein
MHEIEQYDKLIWLVCTSVCAVTSPVVPETLLSAADARACSLTAASFSVSTHIRSSDLT